MAYLRLLWTMIQTAWPWFSLAGCMVIGGFVEFFALLFWFSAYFFTLGFMWAVEGNPYKQTTKTIATMWLGAAIILWPIYWTEDLSRL